MYLKIFFLTPIILLLFTIRIFKKFYINRIRSKKIGDMTTPIEIYICEKKDDPKKIPVIYCMGANVANEFLKKKWSKELIILPRQILEPIYILFKKYKFFNIFFKDYSKEPIEVARNHREFNYIDNRNVLSKYKPSIKFNYIEKNEGENYLKKIGLQNEKFVTFSSRTAEFHNEKGQSLRNSNIQNQITGVNFLVSKGYKAIRMGKNEKNKINFNDSNVIDYATSVDQNDFLDVYLASKCEFMISAESGINELATIFRKPRLIVDHWSLSAFERYNSDVIILPKKFKNINTGNFVSFKEAYNRIEERNNKKQPNLENSFDLNKLGYEAIENNEFEIKKAVESMFNWMEKSYSFNEILKIQKKFFQSVVTKNGYKENSKVIICPNFYLSNIDLFE